MKRIKGYQRLNSRAYCLSSFALIFAALTPLVARAQVISREDVDIEDKTNPPPFDFSDDFYRMNNVDFNKLNINGQRFGFRSNRLTGPPAGPNQVNWKIDSSNTDPIRNNVRILATTGGYKDDTGSPTQFISIIAFLSDRSFFTAAGRHMGAGNARGIPMEDIVLNFEAYGALKQVGSDGVFRPTPCAVSIGDPVEIAKGNCFNVDSIETPHLRQDWRFTTNRNAIDGSAPVSYFGDDLLGMWIITYFWYTVDGFGPKQTADCKAALNFLAGRNGLSLDGTPIIKTGAELHFAEGVFQGTESRDFPPPPNPNAPCAQEANLNRDGVGNGNGPVWLICPSIPDPTQGGIAPDAFLDAVRKPDGLPLDLQLATTFNCLQKTGHFCRLANGTYRVLNQVSGLLWDGSAPAGGTAVQLAALNTAAAGASQQWTFTANPDGTYGITNKATGLALSDPNGSKAPGTSLIQVKADGDSDEKWIVTTLNNGFRITNAASRLTVDATTDTPTPGTSIAQATPTGNTAQVWVIR